MRLTLGARASSKNRAAEAASLDATSSAHTTAEIEVPELDANGGSWRRFRPAQKWSEPPSGIISSGTRLMSLAPSLEPLDLELVHESELPRGITREATPTWETIPATPPMATAVTAPSSAPPDQRLTRRPTGNTDLPGSSGIHRVTVLPLGDGRGWFEPGQEPIGEVALLEAAQWKR